MAQTIALKIDVQDSGKISQLEQNLVKLRQRRSELNKLVREGATLTDKEAKELGELGTQATATANKINDLKNAVLKQNDAFKKSSGFVAGIKEGVGQWATSMIGITAAIGGTIAVVKNITQTITNFDQALADVQAITGATAEEMVGFRKKILEVSAATGKGASDIAKAFQLVGSAQPELLSSADALAEVTKQAITLSQAGGLEVPEAAKALTLAMNQFGASADEAAMFTDILATSQQKGTAEIFELAESLKNVGSVAKVSGLSFETTNAALQALAKGGLVGAEAGTKFRGVLLKLAATGRDELNPATTDLTSILNTLSGEVTDVTKAQKMFGTENAAAALTLIEQRNVVQELDGALNDVGAALEQASLRTNTVNGRMEKLGSTWESFVLSLDGSESVVGNAFKSLIDFTERALIGLKNLGAIADITFGGLTTASEESKAAVLTGWEIEDLGIRLEKFTQKFDNIPIAKIKANVKETQKTFEDFLMKNGETAEDARAIWNIYIKDRLQKEIGLRKELSKPVTTTPEEGGGGTELTQKEKDAINAKAVKIAQQKALAAKVAAAAEREKSDVANVDETVINDELELEALLAKQDALLINDKEYKDKLKLQNEEYQEGIRVEEEKTATSTAIYEQLKRDSYQQTLDAAGGLLNAFASLAEDNSAEQKALATAGAIINTYAAINGTLAAFSGLPIPGYALLQAAAIGVTGFANVAKIQGVKFEDGGILNGASHANGGIPFTVAGRSGFEAEGGEAIINKRSTAMFAPILSAINQAGGGKAFFANGGLTPSSTGVTASQQSASSMLNFDMMADKIVNGINSKEVINVATNTSRVANQVQNVVNNSKF